MTNVRSREYAWSLAWSHFSKQAFDRMRQKSAQFCVRDLERQLSFDFVKLFPIRLWWVFLNLSRLILKLLLFVSSSFWFSSRSEPVWSLPPIPLTTCFLIQTPNPPPSVFSIFYPFLLIRIWYHQETCLYAILKALHSRDRKHPNRLSAFFLHRIKRTTAPIASNPWHIIWPYFQ